MKETEITIRIKEVGEVSTEVKQEEGGAAVQRGSRLRRKGE